VHQFQFVFGQGGVVLEDAQFTGANIPDEIAACVESAKTGRNLRKSAGIYRGDVNAARTLRDHRVHGGEQQHGCQQQRRQFRKPQEIFKASGFHHD